MSEINIDQQHLRSYPQWDVSLPTLPPRSRLFQVAPIGIGTSKVESLTSYISRLAVEHCVSPRKLFCKEVLERIGKQTTYYSDSNIFFGNTINGVGNLAEIAVIGLEQLTLRNDLRHTTLLTWRRIFSYQQLLRKRRAWCSFCYEEQLVEGGCIYDPLIWIFEAVLICPKHRKRLCHICPHCGKQLILLAKHYRPGYCSNCLRWLGATSKVNSNQSNQKPSCLPEITQQIKYLSIIGELLESGPNVSLEPTPQNFANNLTKTIKKNAGQSINLFSDLVGMWSGKIRRLLAGSKSLSMEALCQFCIRLNLSPIDLLCKEEEESLSQDHIQTLCLNKPIQKLITPWIEVEGKLQTALEAVTPPSLEAVARYLGYDSRKLKGHFPTLCEQIRSRYRSYIKSMHPLPRIVRRTFRAALKELPPPSLQSVFRRLGCRDTGYYYYTNYFDLCAAVAQRFKNYRNKPFDKKITQEQLKAALIEEPPPSFSSIAKRLGHSREFFRQKYPEYTQAIASRHMQFRKLHQTKRAIKLRQMIREAIKDIAASGLYASEARVKKSLQQQQFVVGRDSLFKQALREVKSEIGRKTGK